MAQKKIENVQIGMTWTSYIGSVDGSLRTAGLWDGEVWKLMGMTGIGFHFIMHTQLCPSSVTVYDWVDDHLMAMDRIGIVSEVYSIMNIRMNTFAEQQKLAIERIKSSIDEGRPVVMWAPTFILEFGIIYGYDDEDGVFFVKDCRNAGDPLLYENIGKSEVPMLFYQTFVGKIESETEKVFCDSLRYGVSEWYKEFHVNPFYSSGRKAYEVLIKALEEGNFDEFGLTYNLAVYSDAKSCIAKYLKFVEETSSQLDGLRKPTECFEKVAEKYVQLTKLFPFSGSNGTGSMVNHANVPEALTLIKECNVLEEEAFSVINAVIEKQ